MNERIRLWVALGLFAVATVWLTIHAHRLADELNAGSEDRRHADLLSRPAPEFTLPRLTPSAGTLPGGTLGTVTLAEHRGKVVFISFWASWCRPCHLELPVLNQFYLANRERGVEVIAISTDSDVEDAQRYAESNRFAFPMVWDEGGRTADRYRVKALPTMVVVDPAGRVVRFHEGLRYDLQSWLERQARDLAKTAAGPAAPRGGG